MRQLFFSLFLLSSLFSQVSRVTSLIAEVEQGNPENARKYINSLKELPDDSPEVMYLAGLVAPDADNSVEIFRQLINQFPEDPYSLDAMMKIGEYYYVTGLYVQAANWFRRIADSEMDYTELERAGRLLVKSLSIAGESGLVKEYTAKFLQKFPEFLSPVNAEKEPRTTTRYAVMPAGGQGIFSLQAGAFSQIDGANTRADMLVKAGYDARVETSVSGGVELNTVLIGHFKDRETAEKIKSALQTDLGLDSFIVKK